MREGLGVAPHRDFPAGLYLVLGEHLRRAARAAGSPLRDESLAVDKPDLKRAGSKADTVRLRRARRLFNFKLITANCKRTLPRSSSIERPVTRDIANAMRLAMPTPACQ